MDLLITFFFMAEQCDSNGKAVSQNFYDVQITSQALPALNKNLTKFKNQQVYLEVKPYSLALNYNLLDIQINVSVSDNKTLNATKTLNIFYEISNLEILIQNGVAMLVNYKNNLILIGLARDNEVQDPNSPQGIQLSWSCQQLIPSANGDNQCYNYLTQVYAIPQNVLNITINGGTFNPYQTLNFTFSGSKDTRTAHASALVNFAELDLPPLIVVFDDPTQIKRVNINDDISATIIYGSNVDSDILTYAGAILYNNFVVGVIKFDFYKVKFRIWDFFSDLNLNIPVVQVRFTVYNPQNIMPSLSVTNFNINIPPQNCILSIKPQSGQALVTQFVILLNGCTTNNNPLSYQFFYYNQQSDLQQEILVPQNILRRQLQDQNILNQVTTYLPSGNILVMAQAMDKYLAIYNTTIIVNVSPNQSNEQTTLSLLDQALSLQNSNLSINSIINNLCVVGEEIAKNTSVQNLDSVNQKKLLLIQAIIDQSKQLPAQSFLSTFSNKVISALQASLISSDESQNLNVLDHVGLILQKQQQQIASNQSNNKLLNNNDIVLQQLVDSFKIVNSTTQNISQILQQPNNFYNYSFSQNSLQQSIKTADQIGNILNNITIPNQGEFKLEGNLVSMNVQQITSKNLDKFMYIQNQQQQNDSSVYNVVITKYSQNPFIQTSGFQHQIAQLQDASPNINISLNTVIKPFIQNFKKAASTFNNTFQIQFSDIKPSKNNLTCSQQQSDQSWSQSKCSTLNSIQTGAYTCFCTDQQPTTIIENLQSLLDNKNLYTAFGLKGLQDISNFTTFYEYAVFWILSTVTLIQIGLCIYGNILDSNNKHNSVGSTSTVIPINIPNILYQKKIYKIKKANFTQVNKKTMTYINNSHNMIKFHQGDQIKKEQIDTNTIILILMQVHQTVLQLQVYKCNKMNMLLILQTQQWVTQHQIRLCNSKKNNNYFKKYKYNN
ncbi:hypothetical protein ABPG72_020923 [Tetrahymena utriculariae]